MKIIQSLFGKDKEYTVNGATYVVTPVFRHHGIIQNDPTLDKCIKMMLQSDVVPLPTEHDNATMTAENVCSAAGKEDNNAVEKETA